MVEFSPDTPEIVLFNESLFFTWAGPSINCGEAIDTEFLIVNDIIDPTEPDKV